MLNCQDVIINVYYECTVSWKHIRCNTEDWSNDAEHIICFKYIHIEKSSTVF